MEHRIQILAAFGESDDKKACGERECATALEAVIVELAECPADTKNATEISATDEWMTVSAYRTDEGWEIHLYIGENDVYFTVES